MVFLTTTRVILRQIEMGHDPCFRLTRGQVEPVEDYESVEMR